MAAARRRGRAAAGFAQEDLAITGHAIEARLYAEDVPKGFLPATGRLAHLRFGEGARADTGVRRAMRSAPGTTR
jgi:3-methylcrotonyl-CoA carboxylase alpha subunit